MPIYSIDKLIDETRRLATQFRRSTGTMLPVSGEIARYDVSQNLGLTLCQDQNCGYDAIGTGNREGQRVQIKSRVIGDAVKSGHRIGQLNSNGNWDIVILSLMDNDFEPLEMYELTREEVIEAMKPGNKKGTLSVAKFRIIGKLVWTKEQGVEELSCCNYQ